jgi:hypothetical protein
VRFSLQCGRDRNYIRTWTIFRINEKIFSYVQLQSTHHNFSILLRFFASLELHHGLYDACEFWYILTFISTGGAVC